MAGASAERDFPERSNDDIHMIYTGGTTGMPKGVMWRQEDIFFALCGGIDAYTQREGRPAGGSCVTAPRRARDPA